MKLLHIIASPRGEASRTLGVSSEFLNALKAKSNNLEIDEIDLFRENLPEVYGDIVEAKYAFMSGKELKEQPRKSYEEMARYANAFLTYDMYLISTPMWNFSIPYKLKQYIDIIMQAGILFRFTANGVEGLASNKRMYCITSRGSDYGKDSPMNQLDFQENYLRSIFGFAGIHDITFINAQPMDVTAEITQANLNQAREKAREMAHSCEV